MAGVDAPSWSCCGLLYLHHNGEHWHDVGGDLKLLSTFGLFISFYVTAVVTPMSCH